MLLLIDNYDSFVHNLARYFEELGCRTLVVRNDRLAVDEAAALAPEAIVISPGPCTPAEAGISVELVRRLGPRIPILGVCLGHQAIAAAYGGRVVRAARPMHGRTSLVRHDGRDLLAGLPDPFPAARYHSLVVADEGLPAELEVRARTEDGTIMALAHRTFRVHGVQFHPESILTSVGPRILANFLALAGLTATGTCTGDAVGDADPDCAPRSWRDDLDDVPPISPRPIVGTP
jgi:anthranilate synthase/aminodeoxychorismate synthase-like glutamine amidotransferase